jgi:hypothetical protein
MSMVSILVTGGVVLAFLGFGLALAFADRQSQKAAALRARIAEKADNDNSLSRAA